MQLTEPFDLWTGVAIVVAIVVVLTVVLQLAFEGLVLAVGTLVISGLSAGRIKVGERRDLRKPVQKLTGGAVFYYEDAVCHIYQNYAALVGLISVLLIITAVFGVTVWTNAH
jgi:phosphatidylserine synthase